MTVYTCFYSINMTNKHCLSIPEQRSHKGQSFVTVLVAKSTHSAQPVHQCATPYQDAAEFGQSDPKVILLCIFFEPFVFSLLTRIFF